MSASTKKNLASLAIIVAVALGLHAPLLPALWRVLACDGPVHTADSFTHLLRIIHAAELYFPSGHHWGWDPFWFQGFVPFALYPHLSYSALAVLADLLSLDPVRLLNWATVALVFLPSLLAGLMVYRSHGLCAATAAVLWIGSVNSLYGAGVHGLFDYGLFSQQIGLVVFTLFAYELLVARRSRHAAVWCGVSALVHVHTLIVCGFLWAAMSLAGFLAAADRRASLVESCKATALAVLIAAPTIAGLFVAWQQIGAGTFFAMPSRWKVFLQGALVAPWPMVCVVGAGTVLALTRSRPASRVAMAVAVGSGVALAIAGLVKLSIGIATVDRVFGSLLILRSLPITFVWFAMVAITGWSASGTGVKRALLVATMVGVWVSWGHDYGWRFRVDCTAPILQDEPRPGTYDELLDWIDKDRDETATYTMLLEKHPQRRPYGHPLQRLTLHLRQPVLGGHGGELTSIHNLALAQRPTTLSCEAVRRKLQRYAVGYVIGHSPEVRQHFTRCLGTSPAWKGDSWWVFKTKYDWTTFAARIKRFSHDPTWTNLQWDLGQHPVRRELHLPMAAAAPWSAKIDGVPTEVHRTRGDRLVKLIVPRNAKRVSLSYEGYPGEWISVIVSVLAVAWFFVTCFTRTRS